MNWDKILIVSSLKKKLLYLKVKSQKISKINMV